VRSLTDPTFGDLCFSFETFDLDTRGLYTSHQFLAQASPSFKTCLISGSDVDVPVVFQNDFQEHRALKDVLTCVQSQRQYRLDISDYPYDMYHNLPFTVYTDIINRDPKIDFPTKTTLPRPIFCNQEDLYKLAGKLQIVDIRDRVGNRLVNSATGKSLLDGLFGNLSANHTDLYNAYYNKFKAEWMNVRSLLHEFLNELAEEDRARAFKIMGRAVVEMQFQP